MRNGALATLIAAVLAGLVLAAADARADGAIAVGTTGNVVRDGIAFGMVIDKTKEEAGALAVQRCRTFNAPAAAERCKVVATFAGECFAVAYDPKPATPGAGWGVGPDQDSANGKAIAMCEETAGSARKGYCQVESGGCDTTGRKQTQRQAPATSAASPAETGLDGGPRAKLAANTRPPQGAPPAAAPPPSSRPADDSSPLLPVGALVAVGLAYGIGQHVRGRFKAGVTARHLMTGGGLAVATALAVKLLDMAATDALIGTVLAALVALGAFLVA